jgi:mono/diheme cytochrome c family protein
VALLLTSPYLMYAVEHGQSTTDTRSKLSAYELAARLSYQFWQTEPDSALFDAARSGEILTDDGFEAQLDRLLVDPKAERGIAEFIGQWLENPKLEDLDARVAEPGYKAFLDGFVPSSELKEHMQREIVDAALYYLRSGGSFADFFGSNRSFAKTDDLAGLYRVPAWAGAEPPVLADRAGLLTRAALLATGLSDTRPIIKGVLIRKAILCDDVPPPPAEVANSPPPMSDQGASTRQAVTAKTSSGNCASCHTQLINDLGFATENFDALGRLRTEQPLFDAKGVKVGAAAIDTSSVPKVESGDLTASAGAGDLTRLILESDKPYACFARQYFRFTFARVEEPSQDGCALAALKEKTKEKAKLDQVLKSIAVDRSFRERTF